MSFSDLEAQIRACRACSLCQQPLLRGPVVGSGPLDAAIMAIGEAPGETEDRENAPFLGTAGDNFTRLTAAAGIDRTRIYISNIVKCRPIDNQETGVGNLRPPAAAKRACRHFLESQVDLVAPRVIIAVGGTSANFLVGKGTVDALRHRELFYRGILVVVTYHTSWLSLNRDPSRPAAVVEDLRRALAISQGA